MKNIFLLLVIISLSCASTKKSNALYASRLVKPVNVKSKNVPLKTNKVVSEYPFLVKPENYPLNSLIKEEILRSSRHQKQIKEDLSELYEIRKYSPLWFFKNQPTSTLFIVLDQLENSYKHGLDPENYHTTDLKERYQRLLSGLESDDKFPELDIKLTANYLLYSYDMMRGQLNPEKLDDLWFYDKKSYDVPLTLAKINKAKQLRKHINKITPELYHYDQMVKYLESYREIVAKGGWKKINAGDVTKIEPGKLSNIIPQIRERLAVEDKRAVMNFRDPLFYDSNLEKAVKKFQRLHGLTEDGIIGPNTLKWMNVSIEQKISSIELNMERIRWMPRKMGKEYITVNIPEFKLRIYKNSVVDLKMKVIVGKEFTPTPVFSDTLKYLVFSPTWTVPNSIKSEEMLPRLKRNPNHYSGRNYKFYRGWSSTNAIDPSSIDWSQYSVSNFPFNVVQQPGPSNALGLVKFIMPNSLHVYLHDTPSDYLFERTERALSHGCVRLDEPAVLAKYLLKKHKGWDKDEIYDAMHQDEPKTVFLKQPYHVQLTYLTSFVDDKGALNFRDDIYSYDKAQVRKIAL